MSDKIIREGNNNIKYKLQENKLYNTTIVRDSSGNKIATYSTKDTSNKTTSDKLRNK